MEDATYWILEASSTSELMKKVNGMMKSGWEPIGALTGFMGFKGARYSQALIKTP